MGQRIFILSFVLGISGAVIQASATEEFDLEAETSFFEAENAEMQFRDSEDQLFKERLETNALRDQAEREAHQANLKKKQLDARRVQLEQARIKTAKERDGHKRQIALHQKEVENRRLSLEKKQAELDVLAKEVRGLKAQNVHYRNRIATLKAAEKRNKSYMAEGNRQKKSQKRTMAQRKRIIESLQSQKTPASLGRKPASVTQNDLKVNLVPQTSRR